MSQTTKEIATILKDRGLSVTKQRIRVFEVLEGREPISMHELFQLTRDTIDRATLYRIVAAFEKLDIVQRVTIGWKYKIELSDNFAGHHHHLTCIRCHKVEPINEEELESFIRGLAARYGFKPFEHQVEVQGYCETCSSREINAAKRAFHPIKTVCM